MNMCGHMHEFTLILLHVIIYVCQALKGKTGTTLATDEASTRGMSKIAAATYDPDGNPFATGLRELKTKSSSNMLEALRQIADDIDERFVATQPSEGEEASPIHIMWEGLRNLISDKYVNK